MRKIIMFNFVSADGYFAGENGDISWHPVDKEFNSFAVEYVKQCDTALFGRTTYELFANFWPTAVNDPSLDEENQQIARALNDMRKIVVTHSELGLHWQGTEMWHDLDAHIIRDLKQQEGKNIVIYGSGTIVKQLTAQGLIDEYQLVIAPIILGGGKTLFAGNEKKQLNLIESRAFTAGNVLLRYTPSA